MTDSVRIYLAARFHGKRTDPDDVNPHLAAAAQEPYPYYLESYHYAQNGRLDDDIRRVGQKVFLDSGAFSMFTQGAKVDLKKYGQFIRERVDWVDFASNVDAIGAGKEQESYDNQKALEAMGLPVKVYPVHHARDDDRWLVKYLDEGYDYIFLGGMVPETTKYLYEWLDHIWDKYLALPDGSARVRIHGFGLTTFELMERYPWYSVDSTSWVMIGNFGNILMPLGKGGKPVAVSFSSKSPNVKDEGRSFWNLDAATQDHVRKMLSDEGFQPDKLAESYGERDRWNIRFFKRYMDRLHPRFERRAVTFF